MTPSLDRVTAAAAVVAAVLGSASATISAYWAFGGTELLDTVGGTFERWGRERGSVVVLALIGVALLKLVVAMAAPILAGLGRPPASMTGRVPRVLGWIAAITMTLYGGILTTAGVLVELGAIDPAADADRHAIAWHAWFWDPWFLLWGIAFVIVLWRTRRVPTVGRARRTRPGG